MENCPDTNNINNSNISELPSTQQPQSNHSNNINSLTMSQALVANDAERSFVDSPYSSSGGSDSEVGFREQDILLPLANVSRIMKQMVPGSAKISKEAKTTVQECASEFIAFVSAEASEKALNEKRKTVTGDDIIAAMEMLGFDNYAILLRAYYAKYKEAMIIDKTSARHYK